LQSVEKSSERRQSKERRGEKAEFTSGKWAF
jgi:hypothetical protein